MNSIERRIQTNLHRISKWADENGFNFSYDKTVCLHFWKYKASRAPQLELKGLPIKLVQKTKFLGLVWDRGLTFKDHILYLQGRWPHMLGYAYLRGFLLHIGVRAEVVSSWGASRSTLHEGCRLVKIGRLRSIFSMLHFVRCIVSWDCCEMLMCRQCSHNLISTLWDTEIA